MAVRCAVYQFVLDNQEKLNSVILYDRDMSYDYFAYKVCDSRSSPVVTTRSNVWARVQTLERSYLLKLDGKITERPQHMIMRGDDLRSPLARACALDKFGCCSCVRYSRAAPRRVVRWQSGARDRDVRLDEPEVVHARVPHPLQRWHLQPTAVVVLPPDDDRGLGTPLISPLYPKLLSPPCSVFFPARSLHPL
jgi:hypothetical protein